MGDAWEWELADGAKIIARLEMPERIESVWLGPRLVSRSGAGGKGDEHVVPLPAPKTDRPSSPDAYRAAPPPREATIRFDAIAVFCTLRVDGVVVPPTFIPDDADVNASAPASAYERATRRKIFGMPLQRAAPLGAAMVGLLIAIAGPPAYRSVRSSRARAKIANTPAATERTEVLDAPDGSITAHYPADFDSTLDQHGAFISLHRPQKLEMIVLVSMPRTDLDDPRDLDRIMTKELEAFATRTGAAMSTTITVDGTCQGFPGVVSTAMLSKPDQSDDIPLKVATCTMLRNGRGYFFAYLVPDFLAEREEPELRRVVDATDIFDFAPPVALVPPSPRVLRPRTTFSAQGSTTILEPAPQQQQPQPQQPTARRIVRATPAGATTTAVAPLPTIRMGANGSVESAGPLHVNGVNKASDAANDQKMREYRQRVPW